MDPDLNGRRSTTEQVRRPSTRGDNFQRSLHHRQEDSGGHGRTEPPHDNYRIQSPPDFPPRPFARRTELNPSSFSESRSYYAESQ